MNLSNNFSYIKDKDDFIIFVSTLVKDLKDNPNSWENQKLDKYLEAIQSWVEDMDGWEKNLKKNVSSMNPWMLMANILYAAKIYE